MPLLGYSNADLEAVILLANNLLESDEASVDADLLEAAIQDFLPSRDERMLEYMELLAVFESSSRSMLPPRYRDMPVEDLHDRMNQLKLLIS